jgi:hypothetical protein
MSDRERRVLKLLDAIEPAVDRAFWLVVLLAFITFAGGVGLHVLA